MSIFKYLSYKQLLRDEVLSRKKFNSKVNFNSLANAIGSQKTLVSKVLLGDANFNSDQVYLCCEYLGFNETETDYVQLLLDFDRCIVSRRKKWLKEKIRAIQNEQLLPSKSLKAEQFIAENEDMVNFYLDPITQIIHAFLIVPTYSKHPEEITPILGIEKDQLQSSLCLLERIGFIKKNHPLGYQVLKGHTNLSPTSPIYRIYHSLIRTKSLDQLMKLPSDKKYCFSVILSSDEATLTVLKEHFIHFLKLAEDLVKKSDPEKVYQMNFDLFHWG
jgi:uncharacterized protein (TIGR02147 family)